MARPVSEGYEEPMEVLSSHMVASDGFRGREVSDGFLPYTHIISELNTGIVYSQSSPY